MNSLTQMMDGHCSDKGTFFLSRHHYTNAYHGLLHSRRHHVRNVIEVGIGEDTAPSVGAWLQYFPRAHIYAVDIKRHRDFQERIENGATMRLAERFRKAHGCAYDPFMWKAGRAHLTLDTNASDRRAMMRAHLPDEADLIIDDGSHTVWDQQATLEILWPRLANGGVYIVEDIFVGRLDWAPEHETAVPTQNDPSKCLHECYFPQRLAEHPLMYDRFNTSKEASDRLSPAVRRIMQSYDWTWVVTGVHRGGGLDCALVIFKGYPDLATPPASEGYPYWPAALAVALFLWITRRRR